MNVREKKNSLYRCDHCLSAVCTALITGSYYNVYVYVCVEHLFPYALLQGHKGPQADCFRALALAPFRAFLFLSIACMTKCKQMQYKVTCVFFSVSFSCVFFNRFLPLCVIPSSFLLFSPPPSSLPWLGPSTYICGICKLPTSCSATGKSLSGKEQNEEGREVASGKFFLAVGGFFFLSCFPACFKPRGRAWERKQGRRGEGGRGKRGKKQKGDMLTHILWSLPSPAALFAWELRQLSLPHLHITYHPS